MDFVSGLPAWQEALIACTVALIILAIINYCVARAAERKHPPQGLFLEVDGVRLHYSDRGSGYPIVLLHGNAVTGDDYNTSGLAERLIPTNRVIIFDRPGFGYSERPRWRIWTAGAQADLLHKALVQLKVEKPVIVGHSWGTLVALALAIRHQANAAGLILLSGYYFPTFRIDALLVGVAMVPILGDLLCYTISPVLGWIMMPAIKRVMFAPAPMTARFKAEYSTAMSLRPAQVRATAEDGGLMVPSAAGLHGQYGEISIPVTIMAGNGDLVVRPRQGERLHSSIPGSFLNIVEGVGHMIHHVTTQEVAAAVTNLASRPRPLTATNEVTRAAGDAPQAAPLRPKRSA